ncbi:hemerythrin domain-containing protein [bacterium]|nr:hemerythrin domain-containing protein [bacterium]
MGIVETLKEEHATLVAALGAVDSSKIGTEEGNKELFGIKDALLAHLAHEDSDFYPDMKKAAQSNESIAQMIKEFEDDMKTITTAVLAFFDKYTSESSGDAFASDFGELVSNLKQRILMEEDVLFKAYDELSA